jgi:hypothetical protein
MQAPLARIVPRPTAMVVIDGRPPPGRRVDPYVTSVPGVQLARNNSVMQTAILVIARSPQVGCTVAERGPAKSDGCRIASGCQVRVRREAPWMQRTLGAQMQAARLRSLRAVTRVRARRLLPRADSD